MPRATLRIVHAATSTLGLAFIATFFLSTVMAEIGGDAGTVVRVKAGIFYALFALVPIMAAAAGTGRALAGGSKAALIERKTRRMRRVGMNAVFVLIPCVVALHWLASRGRLGGEFVAIQALELLAGGTNVVLLGRNLRDGVTMRAARARGALHRQRSPTTPMAETR